MKSPCTQPMKQSQNQTAPHPKTWPNSPPTDPRRAHLRTAAVGGAIGEAGGLGGGGGRGPLGRRVLSVRGGGGRVAAVPVALVGLLLVLRHRRDGVGGRRRRDF